MSPRILASEEQEGKGGGWERWKGGREGGGGMELEIMEVMDVVVGRVRSVVVVWRMPVGG